jgi:hypothetical protein
MSYIQLSFETFFMWRIFYKIQGSIVSDSAVISLVTVHFFVYMTDEHQSQRYRKSKGHTLVNERCS